MSSMDNGKHIKKVIKIIIILIVIVALVAAAKLFDLKQGFRDALGWSSGLGPLIFIALYIVVCVLMPGSSPTLGAK